MAAIITGQMSVSISAQKRETTTDPTATQPSLNLNLTSINANAFSQTWTASTTPDGQDAWSGQITLTAGAATIDLTNLTQTGLATVVNANTLHVRAICLLADAGNANVIQIGTGASNGFVGIGVISVLNAGNMAVRTCFGSAAVSSTNKTLDLAGTGTQKLNILIIFGT